MTLNDRADRRAQWMLFAVSLFCFTYFAHGEGWNQFAHFDTTRAIVEHGSPEITPYAANTGDVSGVDGRIYSNKPPGLATLGVPVYWLVTTLERAAGTDPAAPRLVTANLHVTTAFVSSLPGALIVVLVYRLFRRDGVRPTDALLLAAVLAFGSLLWPYAGVMMSHVLVGFALLACWHLISDERQPISAARAGVAGLCIAIAGACDYFAAPLIVVFLGYLLVRRARIGTFLVFLLGPLLIASAVAIFNYRTFGGLTTTTYTYLDPHFTDESLFLGHFDWPDFRRLYWLTYHPMRGLFVCCPMFIVPAFSLLSLRRSSFTARRIVPLLIVSHYVIFLLTFRGWTGGWGVGPRYLVPALPFLWLYARDGFVRYRTINLIVIALSCMTMLAVTSVQLMYPANETGAPTHWEPIEHAWLSFVRGQLARTPQSYNLGMLIGLKGLWSILPIAAAWIAFALLARRYLFDSASRAAGRMTSTHSEYCSADGCS